MAKPKIFGNGRVTNFVNTDVKAIKKKVYSQKLLSKKLSAVHFFKFIFNFQKNGYEVCKYSFYFIFRASTQTYALTCCYHTNACGFLRQTFFYGLIIHHFDHCIIDIFGHPALVNQSDPSSSDSSDTPHQNSFSDQPSIYHQSILSLTRWYAIDAFFPHHHQNARKS